MSDDPDTADSLVFGECQREQKTWLHLKIKGATVINQGHSLFDLRRNRSLLCCRSVTCSAQLLAHRLPRCCRHKRWKRKFHPSGSAVTLGVSSAVIYISAAPWSVCDCVGAQLTALWWGTFPFAWPAVGVVVLFPAVSSRDNDRPSPGAPNDERVIRPFFLLLSHCVLTSVVSAQRVSLRLVQRPLVSQNKHYMTPG